MFGRQVARRDYPAAVNGLVPAVVVVLVAELGDKSQLLALSLAARGRPVAVLAGIAVAAAGIHALSVIAGAALRSAVPTTALSVAAGAVFLAFAVWTLLAEEPEADVGSPRRRAGSVALTAGVAFLVAEIGDKTMLATVALASANGPLGTWVGATLGTVAADALAVVVGHRLGRRLPVRVVRAVAAASFAVVGIVVLLGAATGGD